MSTSEFDRLIVKNVSRVSYEYDARDWEQLSLQLAAERRKKRAILFIYVSSGMAAVAIFLIAILPMLSQKEASIPYASHLHTLPPTSPAPPVNNGVNMPLLTQHTNHYNAAAIITHKKQTHPTPDTIAYSAPAIVYNDQPANTVITPSTKHIDTTAPEQKDRQHGYNEPILSQYAAIENKPDHRRINISVAGGVNYGTNTTYAIGAAVDKKLSNKFGVEVIVAYVGSGNQYHVLPSAPGGYFPPTTPLPTSIALSPLNYLQFTPLAGYSLSKKITLSAGADLQRLLQEHDVTVLYNDAIKVVPPIDLGMLLRTEYAVSSSFKAGLSYRMGANNIVAPGNNYFDRNYMQVQVKYRLH